MKLNVTMNSIAHNECNVSFTREYNSTRCSSQNITVLPRPLYTNNNSTILPSCETSVSIISPDVLMQENKANARQ